MCKREEKNARRHAIICVPETSTGERETQLASISYFGLLKYTWFMIWTKAIERDTYWLKRWCVGILKLCMKFCPKISRSMSCLIVSEDTEVSFVTVGPLCTVKHGVNILWCACLRDLLSYFAVLINTSGRYIYSQLVNSCNKEIIQNHVMNNNH